VPPPKPNPKPPPKNPKKAWDWAGSTVRVVARSADAKTGSRFMKYLQIDCRMASLPFEDRRFPSQSLF
jgi:hypothetical protein